MASTSQFNSSIAFRQLETASRVVGQGALAVGIKTDKGVVIATDVGASRRIEMIGEHVGMVSSGVHRDYRLLTHLLKNQELKPVEEVVKYVSTIMQDAARPFCVSLLICGWSDRKPQLYQVDPSGAFTAWQATAIGKNAELVKKFLEEGHNKSAYIGETVHTAFRALQLGGSTLKAENIDMGVCTEQGFRRLDKALVDAYRQSFNK